MADDQPQQTRVLLLNGQTIIFEGDASENSITEINADLLQQALQEATDGADPAEEPRNEEFQPSPPPPPPPPPPPSENATNTSGNNLVAIFQGDQGETHTIQLTMEQAEALGLHFMSDDSEKVTVTPDLPSNVSNQQMSISNDRDQLMYSNNTHQPEDQKPMFDSCLNPESNISNAQDSTSLQGNSHSSTNLQQNIGDLSSLSEVGSYMNDANNITLIPQFVNGQMTYTVKLNEQPSNSIQNQGFSVMNNEDCDGESVREQKVKLPLLAPAMPVSSLGTTMSTASATPVSSIRINSIPTMLNSLTPIAPSLAQSATTTTSYVTQKSLLPPLTGITHSEKTTKYVVVPTSSTTISQSSNSIVTPVTMKGTSLMRAIARPTITAPPAIPSGKAIIATSASSSNHTPSTTSPLTGIPLMNSNINITRTSTAGNSLLQSVSTSITGGGMIRVVAGGTTTRMVQVPSTNGPKFTNILTPSGRLVAAGTTPGTQQKILTVNSTASLTKTTAVTTTVVTTSPTTEPTQSRAIRSAVQTTAARLNINSNKPLGSSENPIQLVQQGQTFHSVQALSQEQLRQIATVLQQQQLDSAPRTKNVLYDAETNTRIIYRVVYPEDLDLREPSSPSEKQISGGLATSSRGRGRRGRPPKIAGGRPLGRPLGSLQESSSLSMGRKSTVQTMDLDLDEDRLVDDATKCERKKQVARTRSGRLSRPPRHMVKDYKRLHHLDFADADLDDSDGGYSDYQMSDREAEEQEGKVASIVPSTTQGTGIPSASQESPVVNPVGTTTLLPGLQASKRKISSHFRCPTCQKVYLGHSRMARHFDVFPEHGSIEQMRSNISAAPSSPMPLPDSTQGKVGIGSTLNGIVRPTGSRRRGKRRGPWAYTTPEARSERRKIKLREAMSTCEASELSEVAGPAVAGVMPMWELLLLRVETVRSGESLMATLCEELRALLEKVQSVAGDVLQPLRSDDITSKEEQIELQDEILCNALGLPSGKYQIVDDHLLTRRSQIGGDLKMDPPIKRLKTEDEQSKLDEKKPICPEVLSALALESRPTSLTSLLTNTIPSSVTSTEAMNSLPSSPSKSSVDAEPMKSSAESTPLSQDENMKESGTPETKQIGDHDDEHPFLLPTTTDMCVDELTHGPVGAEGEHHGTETVDDIVNERLKNLTGFSVSVPENVPVQQANPPVNHFQNAHNSTVPEVPTFDPEMALAAMGEGDQPDTGTSLAEFAPEIALAAMGEGEPDHSENPHRHSPYNPSIQPVFDTIKSMEDDVSPSTHPSPESCESDHPKLTSSPNSTSEVFSNMGISNMNTSQTENSNETKEEIVTFTTSILTNPENTFITSLATSATSINKHSAEVDPSVSNFDPEVALAAMGEGDQSDTNQPLHQDGSFDPETALASMGEGVSSETSVLEYQPQRDSSASETAFQLSGMDVSLDESGPELDFDALSVEFTQSTPHS